MGVRGWEAQGRTAVWLVAIVAFSGCQLLFGVDLPGEGNAGAGGDASMGSGVGGSGGSAGGGPAGMGGGRQGAGGASGSAGSSGVAGGGTGAGGAASGGAIVINELLFDPPEIDTGCFIELKGAPGAPLAGYRLQGINADQEPVQPFYVDIPFDGTHVFDANGYFVLAQDDTVVLPMGAAHVVNAFADLQNGPDNLVLLDPNGAVVDAIGYSSETGTFSPPNVFKGEGNFALRPADGTERISLSRLLDGSDTDDNATDFGDSVPSPGSPNVAAAL